ncbi:MAG TPA: DUF167 domain-containing protein [Dongiaceae bacterium]|jgi:uncharacterized protein (TIGR00251 family)|nr:DUF167 domain-containing protein [Dongiaceae bacterium]
MSSSPEAGPGSIVPAGLRLRLKVQPKARRHGIVGVGPDRDGPALRVAVNAPPEAGKANAAVIALLAEAFDVAKAAVSVVTGATDRHKLVEIRGHAGDLGARLDRLIKDLERNENE